MGHFLIKVTSELFKGAGRIRSRVVHKSLLDRCCSSRAWCQVFWNQCSGCAFLTKLIAICLLLMDIIMLPLL